MNLTIENGSDLSVNMRMVAGRGLAGGSVPGVQNDPRPESVWLRAADATHETVPTPTAAVRQAFPAVNTPEWDAMNERRAELIRKDIDEGLTEAERAEYEYLQRMSLAAVVKAFPRAKPDFEELARLRKELGDTPAPVAE